ncbi:MAG: carbohydrate ABC transporter permease [Terrimesophilobacter sp.]
MSVTSSKQKLNHRTPLARAGSIIVRLLLLLLFLLPIYLAVVSAFRPNGDIFRYGGTLAWQTFIPVPFTLVNFQEAWALPNFPIQIVNTAVLALVQATATVALALLAAFALARIRFRFRGLIFYLILITMFIPFEALAAPLFLIVKDLGQLNSFWGLLLPWIAAPIAIFILRQAIADIPASFDEAVMLDGGSLRHIFTVVIVPSVWPAMLTAWLTTFIFSWDSFLWPLIIIQDPAKQLAQVGIVSLINPNEVHYGTLFAASLIVTIPVVVMFLLLQRYYQEGTVASGLK